METIQDCKHPDCRYNIKIGGTGVRICNYLDGHYVETGIIEPRGCKISECTKYKPKQEGKTLSQQGKVMW